MFFSFFSSLPADYNKLVYDFNFKSIDGSEIKLSDYKNKVDNWLKDLNWQLDINDYKKIENFIFD